MIGFVGTGGTAGGAASFLTVPVLATAATYLAVRRRKDSGPGRPG